jgi:hypothetical protein
MKKQVRNRQGEQVYASTAGPILLGALVGGVGGLGLGVAFTSLAMAVFGAMGGAVAGMIGAAKATQTASGGD